ncbi:hypothetical protein [Halocalculus aciditolerans]|uniref:Uncharacterized protein n=1 Tax=Halocalculus aciditolerans TaxID=1383812 RepID=A0A830FGK7_9EURY|nr:hypothetical protein [Halocalculus aciditolerans]GGL53613.1 hypothetical protein GCM10009039_09770 [Halocalculus aciditolerans]
MPRHALPAAVSGGLALVDGVLRGLQQFGPAFLVDLGTTTITLGQVIVAVHVLGALVSPILALAAGYWLGGRVPFDREWSTVLLAVAAAALVAFFVGEGAFVVGATVVADGMSVTGPSTALVVVWEAVVGTVTLATAVFAGGAVRTFRQT